MTLSYTPPARYIEAAENAEARHDRWIQRGGPRNLIKARDEATHARFWRADALATALVLLARQ